MRWVILVVVAVLVCAAAGAAYVGYRTIKTLIASGCLNCIYVSHGGEVVKGSGHITTETRTIDAFNAVVVESAARVTIERTGTVSLSVTGDDNLLPFYTATVTNGTLHLAFAKDKSFQGTMPVFRVTAADLRDLRVQGSGDLTAGSLEGDALSVSVSGSGDVRVAGRADDVTLAVSGSGSIDAAALAAKRAKVALSGSGDITVNASDTLDVRLSGSGDVHYLGSPKLTSSVSGSWSIDRRS